MLFMASELLAMFEFLKLFPLFNFIHDACLYLLIVFPKYSHIWFFPKISALIAEVWVEVTFFPYTQAISDSQLIYFTGVPMETSQL